MEARQQAAGVLKQGKEGAAGAGRKQAHLIKAQQWARSRAQGQARQGDRSELCDGKSEEKQMDRGGGVERRGGWLGERESSRRQAAHLIKAQQWAIAASSETVSQKKYRRKEEGERREEEDGTGRGKAAAGKPLTLSRRTSGRGGKARRYIAI